jgi:hypothetical protein
MLDREETIAALSAGTTPGTTMTSTGSWSFLHDEVEFENWTGAGAGRERRPFVRPGRRGLANHGGFRFTTEDLFVDEKAGKVLFRWTLDWPSGEKDRGGSPSGRRGVDVMRFRDGRIVEKYTYSKTTLEIGGKRVKLIAETR